MFACLGTLCIAANFCLFLYEYKLSNVHAGVTIVSQYDQNSNILKELRENLIKDDVVKSDQDVAFACGIPASAVVRYFHDSDAMRARLAALTSESFLRGKGQPIDLPPKLLEMKEERGKLELWLPASGNLAALQPCPK